MRSILRVYGSDSSCFLGLCDVTVFALVIRPSNNFRGKYFRVTLLSADAGMVFNVGE